MIVRVTRTGAVGVGDRLALTSAVSSDNRISVHAHPLAVGVGLCACLRMVAGVGSQHAALQTRSLFG